MGAGRACLIHCNPYLDHQADFAKAFCLGFREHGIAAAVTEKPDQAADTHVVIGPWYALKYWTDHPRVLYADRAFTGDVRWRVSLGRLKPGSLRGREYLDLDTCRARAPALPAWRPQKKVPSSPHDRRLLLLGDFGGAAWLAANTKTALELARWVTVRPHPVETKPLRPLATDIEWCHIAMGHSTTALVDAQLAGCDVRTDDPHHICASQRRLTQRDAATLIAGNDWSHQEIADGIFWDFYKCQFES